MILNRLLNKITGINKANFEVNFLSRVVSPENIIFEGDIPHSFANKRGCFIQAKNGIIFGKDVIWADNVAIISANHNKKDHSRYDKDRYISIGDNVWIGFGAVILPGVSLGNNVIVGANAVVTKSFPKGSVIAGNPAKVIK